MKYLSYILIAATCLGLVSCKSGKKLDETPTRGTANILVDETFYPMVDGQVRVFESRYKYAMLNVTVLPEQQITKLLLSDSARVAILSRDLTSSEIAHFESKNIIPRVNEIGYDAIALIVSKSDNNAVISEDELKLLLTGKSKAPKYSALVFDHSQSSTVQYMKNYANVSELSNVYSLNSNAELLKYVAEHKNTIGFIGVDWLYEPDSIVKPYVDKVKVLAVQTDSGSYKPTQNDIALGAYPFIRKIRIVNCQGATGLGLGFASFLASDVGQRIILKSGLVPTTYPKREIIIKN